MVLLLFRSMDVESGPDADTPRPVGVGLLLCMLERGGESVAQALLQLATELQVRAELPNASSLQYGDNGCSTSGTAICPTAGPESFFYPIMKWQ